MFSPAAAVLFTLLSYSFWSHSSPDKQVVVQEHECPYMSSSLPENLNLSDFPAALCGADGKLEQRLRLKHGHGKSKKAAVPGGHFRYELLTQVELSWQHPVDRTHTIASYAWEWIAGSSSHSEIVQVFEKRDGQVFITQQIEIDTHHGGTSVGATYDVKNRVLICKAVDYAPGEGRCCPSLMDVVRFRWNGTKFVRVSIARKPLPKDN